MHIHKVKLTFSVVFHVFRVLLPEESPHRPLFRPLLILLGSHQNGGIQVRVAQLRAYVIHIGRIIVLHRLTDIIWHPQVEGTRVEVIHQDGSRGLNAPTCPQRILLRLRTRACEQQGHNYPRKPLHLFRPPPVPNVT